MAPDDSAMVFFKPSFPVIPAKAGIQKLACFYVREHVLSRGNDGLSTRSLPLLGRAGGRLRESVGDDRTLIYATTK